MSTSSKRHGWISLIICLLTLAFALTQCAPLSSPPVAEVENYVRIKNKWQGTYLYEADNQVKYGTPAASDQASHWLIEDFQGSKRIKNQATGNYLAIEHLYDYVESIPAQDSWMSARWAFENAPTPGYTIIRSVQHNREVMHIQNLRGYAQHGTIPASDGSTQWLLESPNAPTATPTSIPTRIPTPRPTNTPGATATPVPPGTRGATVPWIEYEAEDGSTNGTLLGPSRTFGQVAAESSGRRSVQLSATGQYVQLTASQAANSIVVRYVIPDAPTGGGITTTLSLYVNGTFRQKLNLTSKYAWSYGGEANSLNDPAVGGAHHFFDEARALVGGIPAGATVKLQKDSGDTAAYYVVDLVDLEQVGPAKTMPANFISIADCGATPDDATNDGQAIQNCINLAKSQGKGAWIPAGTFESTVQLQSDMGIMISRCDGAGRGHVVLDHPRAVRALPLHRQQLPVLRLRDPGRDDHRATTTALRTASTAAPAAARGWSMCGSSIPRSAGGSARARRM